MNPKYRSFFIFSIGLIALAIAGYLIRPEVRTEENSESEINQIRNSHLFLNLNDTVNYVGKEKCLECHKDMYDAYIKTGMGQSWGKASPQKSASQFHKNQPLHDLRYDFYYQPFWRNKLMWLNEYQLSGKDTVYQRIQQVNYVVGSGQHTNSHIYSVNGYLYQIPFTYYTQNGVLDFPPGFENGRNARFNRMIGSECISCHNSYPKQVKGSVNKYTHVPEGINCERCHGPGSLHVATMEAGFVVDTKNEADFTIVNPKRLPPKLEDQICIRCHNQGISVLKKGKTFYDFKPGMYVSDILDVYREKFENDDDAFWMETHPERLHKSACYQKSMNTGKYEPLRCTSCHFTAGMKHVSHKNTPVDSFIARCTACHTKTLAGLCSEKEPVRSAQNNNCITCHMVKTGVFDIPHVQISDHYIRVTDKWKKDIKSTSEIETGAWVGLKCMNNEHPTNESRARAYIYYFEKFSANPAVLDSALNYLVKLDQKEFAETWIYYFYLKGDFDEAIRLSSFLDSNSTDAVIEYQVGQSMENTGHKEAQKYYEKACSKMPYNLDYRNKLGSYYLKQKQYNKALNEFNFIINEQPLYERAYNNRGYVFLMQGETQKAEQDFKEALRLDPLYKTAAFNLAGLYFQQQKVEKAKEIIFKMEKYYPADPQIKEALRIFDAR